MECVHCKHPTTRKNGKLPSGGQRRACLACNGEFSMGGKRMTYTTKYKEGVATLYVHVGWTAQQVIEKFHISSKTLISWAKLHKDTCLACELLQQQSSR